MKVLFLVNPRSGIRRVYDLAEVIRGSCDWAEYEIVPCERKEDLDEIAANAIRDRIDALFAVGGDGTVHEVAKRLIGTPVALGIVPTGSGNGFARHIGLPMDPRAVVRAGGDSRIESIDSAVVNGIPFIGVMGIGFDAWIADRFASSPVRGLRTYVREGLRGYATYGVEEYDLTFDGKPSRRRAMIVAIANTTQYGNNARIAPLASVMDGMLDVMLIDRISLLRAPFAVARLFGGTLHRARGVEMLRAREIAIRRPAAGPAHLDGEPLMLPEQLEIKVHPASLKVLVPRNVSRL